MTLWERNKRKRHALASGGEAFPPDDFSANQGIRRTARFPAVSLN